MSSRRLPNHSLFGLSLDPKAEKSDIMELFPLLPLLQPPSPWRSAWKLWWSKADLQKDRKPKVKIISVIQNHLISFFVLNILWSELYSFTVLHTLHQSWLSLAGQDDIKTREPAIFTQQDANTPSATKQHDLIFPTASVKTSWAENPSWQPLGRILWCIHYFNRLTEWIPFAGKCDVNY